MSSLATAIATRKNITQRMVHIANTFFIAALLIQFSGRGRNLAGLACISPAPPLNRWAEIP
jgi:hypothetical protein